MATPIGPVPDVSRPSSGALVGIVDHLSRRAATQRSPHVSVFSYRRDFELLWSRLRKIAAETVHTGGTVVLVWDATPLDDSVAGMRLTEHLTAFDWSVAFVLEASRVQQAEFAGSPHGPYWRCLVVDAASTAFPQAHAVGLLRSPAVAASLSGGRVRVFPPSKYPEFVETILGDSSGARLREVQGELLRNLWAAALTRPTSEYDRHAVTNLVGIQMLLPSSEDGSVEVGQRDFGPQALAQLLKALDLAPTKSTSPGYPWATLSSTNPSRPGIVLVDDMADAGWAEFLSLALDLSRDQILVSSSPMSSVFGSSETPQSLLDLLTDSTGTLRVGRGVDLSPAAHDALLFLDLRFFSNRARSDELEFFARMLPLAKQAIAGSGSALPRPGFAAEEITALESVATTSTFESDAYHTSLTVLPRLIALVDPFRPVVLFSTTGQRRIMQALAPYGNIITDFDKPRFFTVPAQPQIDALRPRFQVAIDRAQRLSAARRFLRQVQDGVEAVPTLAAPARAPSSTPSLLVQVFIDESRRRNEKGFRVGGYMAIFEGATSQDATALSDHFHASLADAKLLWGPSQERTSPSPNQCKYKKLSERQFQELFEVLDNVLGSQSVLLVPFSVCRVHKLTLADGLRLTSPGCLDNLYRSLVTIALEIALFETLPDTLIGCAGATVEVHIATRQRYQDVGDSKTEWTALPARYGVKIKDDLTTGEKYFTSMASDDAYPLVAQVLEVAGPGIHDLQLAKASPLLYVFEKFGDAPKTHSITDIRVLPRAGHFLADQLAREGSVPAPMIGKEAARKKWLRAGFDEVADESLGHLLNACRYARAGNKVESLIEATVVSGAIPPWARPRLAQIVATLSGEAFDLFCSRS